MFMWLTIFLYLLFKTVYNFRPTKNQQIGSFTPYTFYRSIFKKIVNKLSPSRECDLYQTGWWKGNLSASLWDRIRFLSSLLEILPAQRLDPYKITSTSHNHHFDSVNYLQEALLCARRLSSWPTHPRCVVWECTIIMLPMEKRIALHN